MVSIWRNTRVRGEGKVLAALEDRATSKNCLGCIIDTAFAENVLDVTVIKEGEIIKHVLGGESLHHKIMETAVIRYPPFITFPEYGTPGCLEDFILDEQLIDLLDGTEYRLLRHLSSKFNFTTRFLLRQQLELWGTVYDNDTASGVIGMIKDGSTHFGVGGFNWDLRYWPHVDQLLPYRRTLVKFLSPRRGGSANWLALVHPFDLKIWSSIFVVVLAAATCLNLAQRVEIGQQGADFVLCLLVSLSVLAQQGDVPKYWSHGVRRPILVGLQLCVILLGACYCALLFAVLTVEQAAQQVDSVQELVDSNLRLTDVDEIWPGQLRLSDDQNIATMMKKFRMSSSWDELLKRLNSGKFSYTVECLDTGFLCLQDDIMTDMLENLHLSEDFVLTSEIAMVMKKGFPLKNAFDRETSHLIESGILKMWEEQVVRKIPERDMGRLMKKRGAATVPIAIGLSHMGGPFMMLIFGLCLALFSFFMEVLFCGKSARSLQL
ncbi:Hypothetical predicted protein [Cloeon dipterum]|uniref:Ionotropic glutamate receptor C-terminal domain-containing protein n=1 Tax=Cloeon dipterum TaxID=197152 RepID=A0A8S1C1G7_9INSE|nr:Hypothetical predicted protein [Cloeon dipterum]